jgi:glutamine synthetase adenylyltransferase
VSRSALAAYLANDAAAWELLAYVKLRGVYSIEPGLADAIATECTTSILARGRSIPTDELTSQTHDIRLRLERERQKLRRTGDIDIKYGSGGMLDIYFTIRFLQLRGSVADRDGERTSDKTLKRLLEKDLLSTEDYRKLSSGYEFLSALDHYLRLYIGRTTKVPTANPSALKMIAERMNTGSSEELLGELTIHRINIRQAFENVLSMRNIRRL